MKPLRVGLAQMNAGRDVPSNLARIADWIRSSRGLDLLALPEVCCLRGDAQDYDARAETPSGPLVAELRRLAAEKKIWLLAGSFPERADGGRPYNTSVLVDRAGDVAATYRKMHLFEARMDDDTRICEADCYRAGATPTLTAMEGWRVGLSICFDLRFPELYRDYARQGAHLLLAPSDFTRDTGRAHWETLLRARAIENRCFVLAPNQCGAHPVGGVVSYGNSMAVGPWGEILGRAGETDEGILEVELDPRRLTTVRRRLPCPH
jgi:deaminated glutathione amidase